MSNEGLIEIVAPFLKVKRFILAHSLLVLVSIPHPSKFFSGLLEKVNLDHGRNNPMLPRKNGILSRRHGRATSPSSPVPQNMDANPQGCQRQQAKIVVEIRSAGDISLTALYPIASRGCKTRVGLRSAAAPILI